MKTVRVMLCGAMLAAAAAVLPLSAGTAAAFPAPGVAPGAVAEVKAPAATEVAYKYKKYKWKYNFRSHGPRYKARRAGFNFFYGGYWYSRAWWNVGPNVHIGVGLPLVKVGVGSAHVRWCNAHYKHYNRKTNLYIGKNGKRHVCVSPY